MGMGDSAPATYLVIQRSFPFKGKVGMGMGMG